MLLKWERGREVCGLTIPHSALLCGHSQGLPPPPRHRPHSCQGPGQTGGLVSWPLWSLSLETA